MRCLVLSALFVLGCGAGGGAPAQSSDQADPSGSSGSSSAEPGADAHDESAPAPSTAALNVKPPKKGTVASESRNIKMDFQMTLHRGESPAGMQSGTWAVDEQRSMQVREVGDNAITVLSVVYGKRIAQPLLGIEKKPVTAGNKYLIKAASGGAAVTDLDGGSVNAEQRDAVLSEFGYVGAPSLLLEVVASKPANGAKTTLSTRQALALLGEVPGLNIDKTQVVLSYIGTKDAGRKRATFSADVSSEIVSGKTVFGFKLKGPAVIDVATGWVSSLSLEGPINPSGKVKTKKGMLDVKGKGTIKIARSTEF